MHLPSENWRVWRLTFKWQFAVSHYWQWNLNRKESVQLCSPPFLECPPIWTETVRTCFTGNLLLYSKSVYGNPLSRAFVFNLNPKLFLFWNCLCCYVMLFCYLVCAVYLCPSLMCLLLPFLARLKVKNKIKTSKLVVSEKTEKYRHVLLTTAGPKEKQRLQKSAHSAQHS